MAKDDLRINAHGVSVSNLQPGSYVVVEFNDAPPEVGLLVEVEDRPASYKGERDLKVLFRSTDGTYCLFTYAVHTQVKAVVGTLDHTTFDQAIANAKLENFIE